MLLFSCHYIILYKGVLPEIEATKLQRQNGTSIKPLSSTDASFEGPEYGEIWQNAKFVIKDGSCHEIKLFIPEGNYNSPQHLVEQIQIEIEEKCGAILRQIHSMITISYTKSGNRVSLHVENPNRVQIRFSKSLGKILGLNLDLSNKLIGNGNQVFTCAVDLNIMFVYSGVADYTYVVNITAPIPRIVSYKQ